MAEGDNKLGETWVERMPEVQARRRQTACLFSEHGDGESWAAVPGGLEELYERGLVAIEPQGARVLIRGVLEADARESGLWTPMLNPRDAIVFEVLALGPGCPKFFGEHGYTDEQRIKPGDFVWVLSTVTDRMANKSRDCRLWTVDIAYCPSRVTPIVK